MRTTTKYALATTAIYLFTGNPSWAQSAAAKPDAPQQAGGEQLEEVVVTAEKRAEDIQKTPLAITAIDGDTLKRDHVTNPNDLTNVVPDVNVDSGGAAGDNGGMNAVISVRGLGASSAGPQGSPGVAVHQDGIFQNIGLASNQFYDLSRIEVSPGPQGTLYGRSAAAGAVNVITNKPTDTTEAGGSIEAGTYGMFRADAMVNFPVSDTFFVRAAFQSQEHDGYLSNGLDDEDSVGGRVQILWKPNDSLSIRIAGEYLHNGGEGSSPVFVGPVVTALKLPSSIWQDSLAQFTLAGGVPVSIVPSIDDRKWELSSEINYDFGPALLTIIPAFLETDLNNQNNPIGSPYSTYGFDSPNKEKSLEVRFNDPGDTLLKWTAGVNIYDNVVNLSVLEGIVPDALAVIPPGPFGPFTGIERVNAFDNSLLAQQDSYAAFTQATYPILDWLRLTGGVRYNYDSSAYIGQLGTTGLFVGPSPNFIPKPIVTPTLTSADRWYATTWKAAIDADVTPTSLAYASVGTGYKPGGLNDGGPASSNVPPTPLAPGQVFGPEKVTHYEIGSKNRFLDNRLQVNDALYYDDYKDYQNGNTQPVNPLATGVIGFVVTNAGHAKIYGDELSINYLLTENDRIDFSVNYLHASFLDYRVPAYLGSGGGVVPAANYSGYRLPNSPEFSGNAMYQHVFGLDSGANLTAQASTHVSGSYWSYFQEQPGTKQGFYTKSTVSLTYDSADGNWSLEAYGKNLEDRATLISGQYTQPFTYVFIDAPRTAGVVLTAHFTVPKPLPPEVPPAPVPAATPPAPVAKTPEAQREFQVFFDFDKSNITDAAAQVIRSAAAAVKAGNVVHLTVTGHTDTVGTAKYNQALSERRAASVKTALVSEGVDSGEITTIGVGKSGLLVPTGDGVREPQNRRAVIQLQ